MVIKTDQHTDPQASELVQEAILCRWTPTRGGGRMPDDFVAPFEDGQLTRDRDRVPKYGADLIGAPELRITKWAIPVAGAIAAMSTGLATTLGIGTFPSFATFEDERARAILALGFLLVLACTLLSLAHVAAADVRARGVATAASLALRAQPFIHVASSSDVGQSAGLWDRQSGIGGDDEFLVVAVRPTNEYDGSMTASFLLARGDDTPRWVKQDDITAWKVQGKVAG